MTLDTWYTQHLRWVILFVTTLSSFMSAFDSNVVSIALPKIGAQLGTGVSLLGWVITGYVVAMAASLLQSGKIGDKYGKKRIYLIGFAMFGLTSILCGLSQNVYELISFRVVQGFSAAVLQSTSGPLIFDSFPIKQRGTAIGVNAMSWSVGSVAGPVLGGFLVSLDWRLIFYINAPISALAVLIGRRSIQSDIRHSLSEPAVDKFNLLNAMLLGFTVSTLFIWLTFFDASFAFLSIVGIAAFIFYEYRSSNPLLSRELRKNREFVYSTVAVATEQLAFLGMPFVFSFYYQLVAGFSPILTGLSIAPLSIALVISSPLSGKLYDKMRFPPMVSIAGTMICGLATLILGMTVSVEPRTLSIASLLFAIGIGDGIFWATMFPTILNSAKPELRGLANGTANTLLYIGYAASIAITVAVSATFLPQSVVSQIYLGNVTKLSTNELISFNQGIAQSLLIFGLIYFVSVPFLILVLLEERKTKRLTV